MCWVTNPSQEWEGLVTQQIYSKRAVITHPGGNKMAQNNILSSAGQWPKCFEMAFGVIWCFIDTIQFN